MTTEKILNIRRELTEAFGDADGIELKLGDKNYDLLWSQMAGLLNYVAENKVSFGGMIFSR